MPKHYISQEGDRTIVPHIIGGAIEAWSGSAETRPIRITNSGSVVIRPASGIRGFTYIRDTAVHTGSFIELQTLGVVTASLSYVSSSVGNDLNSVILGSNVSIYGEFTSIKLNNGELIAYIK